MWACSLVCLHWYLAQLVIGIELRELLGQLKHIDLLFVTCHNNVLLVTLRIHPKTDALMHPRN